MDFDDILKHVEDAGYLYLGGFHPEARQTLVLIGNAGPQMWQNFSSSCDTDLTTLDQWTKTTNNNIIHYISPLFHDRQQEWVS